MMTTAAGQVSDNLQHASNMLIMDRHYSQDQLLQQQNTFLLRQKEFQIKELEIENERDRERERERERERVRADEEIERRERMKIREMQSRENEIRVSKQFGASLDQGPNLESLGYEESSLSRMHGGGGMGSRDGRDGQAVSQSLFQKPFKGFSASSDILQVRDEEEEVEEYGDDYDDDRSSRISGDNPDGLDGYSIAFDIERSRMSTGFTGFAGLAETLPARKENSTSSNTAFSSSLDIPRERNWRDLRGFGGGERAREGGGGEGGGRVLHAEHAHSQDKYQANVSRSGSRIQNQDSEYSDTFEDENDNNNEEEDDDYYSRRASEVERRVKAEGRGEIEGDDEDEVDEESGYLSRSQNKIHSVEEKSRSLINDSVPYDVTYDEDILEEDSGTEHFSPKSSNNRNINNNNTARSRSNKKKDVNRTSNKKGGTEDTYSGLKKKEKQKESHMTEEMNGGESDSSGTYTTDSYTASDDKITTSFSPSTHLLLRGSSQSPPRSLFPNTGGNPDILRNQGSGSPDRRIRRCDNSFHSIPFHSIPFPLLAFSSFSYLTYT